MYKSVYSVFIFWVILSIGSLPVVVAGPDHQIEIRELEGKIQKATGKELTRALSRLIVLYENRSPGKAMAYCVLLKKEYEALGDAEGIASVLYDHGNFYYYTGYYDKALKIYGQMVTHCEENKLDQWLGKAYVITGRVYYRQGDYHKALDYFEKSLKIRQSINDIKGVSCALNNFGLVYADLGDYTRAVKFQFDSLKGYERIGDNFGIGFSYENIGNTYFILKNYEKSLAFFLKSHEAYQEIGDAGWISLSLLNIGNCYRKAAEYTLALDYYDKALKTARRKNLGWIIPWAVVRKASVYNDIGSFDKAIDLGGNAQESFNEIDDQTGLYITFKVLALAYLELDMPEKAGDIMVKRMALAEKNNEPRVLAETYNIMTAIYTRLFDHGLALDMLEKGRILATSLQSDDLLSENKRQASVLYAAIGDHRSGLISFRQYRDMEDKKTAVAMKGRLLELENAYERERKSLERKVGLLYWLLAGIAGLIAAFGIFMAFRSYQRQLAEKTALNRTLHMESRLKLFQARVNPHFLFNSLDSVIRLGQRQLEQGTGTDQFKQTLMRLSRVYKNILAMPDLAEVSIQQEFDLVKDYLGVEQQISRGRIDFHIHLPWELKECTIIPLCVLTLAENAVKHGLSPKKEGGSVRISVARRTGSIEIRVKDDGMGFDVEKMDRGFGLYSIQKRLELHYKGRASLKIESKTGEFTWISIRIPYGNP